MAVRDFKIFFRRREKFVRQPHDDKKSFCKVKEEKKEKKDRRCFKCGDLNHSISDCPKNSFNDQKACVGGCWSESDEEDESKRDEICLMALDNNEEHYVIGMYWEILKNFSLEDRHKFFKLHVDTLIIAM
ncbi:zf-CCHC domain-containing protein, partial [Tanacetum coccineum]